MLLWFVFGAIFGVWNVFQSPGSTSASIAAGALLPDAASTCRSARRRTRTRCWPRSSCSSVTMLATTGRGRRLRRRRALGLAIGWFAGLVLSAAWSAQGGVLVARVRRGPARRAAVPGRGRSSSIEELLGLAAAWWAWTRFGLRDAARRRELVRTGRLTIVGGSANDRVRPPRPDRAQPRWPAAGPARRAAERSRPAAGGRARGAASRRSR